MLLKAIFISLFIHAAIFTAIFVSHYRRPTNLIHSKNIIVKIVSLQPKFHQRTRRAQHRQKPIGRHFHFLRFPAPKLGAIAAYNAQNSSAHIQNTDSQKATSAAFDGAFKGETFYEKLWQTINQSTDYPEDFVRSRTVGKVYVSFVVDKRGVLQNFLSLSANNRLLELYVASTLVNGLKKPLSRRFWLSGREKTQISAIFDFETYSEPSERPPASDSGSLKSYFYFQKFGYVNPKLNQIINKLYIEYFPPIEPIPGGFIVDLVHAYEMIHNWNKEDPDQKRQERLREMIKILKENIHRTPEANF